MTKASTNVFITTKGELIGKRIVLLIAVVVLFTFSLQGISAQTNHGCLREGSGSNAYQHCLSSSTISTLKFNLSHVYYYQYGGMITYNEAHTYSASVNVSFTGTVKWPVGSVAATVGVSFSVTQTLGTGSIWYVPEGFYSQIRAIFPRKNVTLKVYHEETLQLMQTQSANPSTNDSFYIAAEYWN